MMTTTSEWETAAGLLSSQSVHCFRCSKLICTVACVSLYLRKVVAIPVPHTFKRRLQLIVFSAAFCADFLSSTVATLFLPFVEYASAYICLNVLIFCFYFFQIVRVLVMSKHSCWLGWLCALSCRLPWTVCNFWRGMYRFVFVLNEFVYLFVL